ncbi:restriction endonuclease subunit S [Limosilactobacillus reuteri]|uniref:restriction endonuclease subunit S n=1 Tax=Limosilactobacillus reuteri TaxID=1598 RepID=UPI0028E4F75B|nr:restriction endonuclease subunit S [Limosilactobacillus reuteri]
MKYKISELVSINSKAIKKDYDGLIKYIDTSSVNNGKFDNPRTYSTLHDAPSRARRMASVGDTVISTVRPNMKHIGFISENNNYVYSTGFAVVSPNRKLVDPYYLYLYLSSAFVTKTLQSIGETSTSTYPSIKPNDIGNLSVDIPSMKEQTVVAKRIRLLDEKIKFNNRINDNLLELNSTCFKKIFDTSNDYQPADSIADIKIGKTPPRKQSEWFSISSKDLTWVSIKDMKDNTAFISSSNENITLKAVDRFNINVVPKNTVILSFKLTIGRVKISNHELTTNEAIAQFQNSSLPWEFLYTYLKLFPYGTLGSTSSIAKAINSKIIKKMPVLVPNKSLMNQYLKLAIPIFNSLREIQEEQNKLRSVKQELLTKYF